jgi:Alginate export
MLIPAFRLKGSPAAGGAERIISAIGVFLQLAGGALLIGAVARAATMDPAPPSFRLLRYDEDYAYLAHKDAAADNLWESSKYIPFDALGREGPFLSFGGELRFQYIEKWDDQFGRIQGAEGSLQQRYMLHTDLVWPKRFRIFGQLLSAWEHGRKPASLPTDANHLDAQQIFAEIKLAPEAETNDYLRVGRQEILLAGHQLLKVREGPDVRLAFDGARLHLAHQEFDADAFATNVVQPKPGGFDDSWTDDSVRFAGANIGWQPTVTGWTNLRADAFVFDYYNRFARYEQASGAEHRQTYGLRASGRLGPWDFDYEASVQGGTLGALNIHAWGVALFTVYRWDAEPLKPRLTFGLSSVTGDRNRSDHQLNTFNCLFARGDYFGDTSLLTGSNTLDGSLLGECSPSEKFHVGFQWDRLWRSETTDGLYAPPLIYIRSGLVSNSRDIGNQFTLTTTFNVNRFVTIQAIGAVFVAGDFIEAGPTKEGTEGLTLRTQFKF